MQDLGGESQMNLKEVNEYRKYTGPAEMHKSINILIGLLKGIAADCIIDETEFAELKNWYELHHYLMDRHPYNEILPVLDSALANCNLESENAENLAWMLEQLASTGYYDMRTSAIQQLHGTICGIMANKIITDSEMIQLLVWIESHDFLSGTYPFDEITSLLTTITSHGIITEDDRKSLFAFFSNFIDTRDSLTNHAPEMDKLRKQYSISGICATNPNITIPGKVFSFTGTSDRTTRADIVEQIIKLGGTFSNTPTKKTHYLIVGSSGNPCWAFACYGRKVEIAMSLRKDGFPITIVGENDFWIAVDKEMALV